jgi:sterol desaturase/sphingolipid hydroxylase (fatty acid hydroxylase superfamily)
MKAHHSSRHLDWLAAFRSHIVEQLFRRILAPVFLIIAGFPPQAVAVAGGLFLAWGIFNHSNLSLRLPWLSSFFITPPLHRLHHVPGSDQRNFGTVFSLWDRLRGTLLTSEADSNAIMGVPGEVETYPQS